MEGSKSQVSEKDGRSSTISRDGGEKVSKSDQPTFTTASGEKHRFVNLMEEQTATWLKAGISIKTTIS